MRLGKVGTTGPVVRGRASGSSLPVKTVRSGLTGSRVRRCRLASFRFILSFRAESRNLIVRALPEIPRQARDDTKGRLCWRGRCHVYP